MAFSPTKSRRHRKVAETREQISAMIRAVDANPGQPGHYYATVAGIEPIRAHAVIANNKALLLRAANGQIARYTLGRPPQWVAIVERQKKATKAAPRIPAAKAIVPAEQTSLAAIRCGDKSVESTANTLMTAMTTMARMTNDPGSKRIREVLDAAHILISDLATTASARGASMRKLMRKETTPDLAALISERVSAELDRRGLRATA